MNRDKLGILTDKDLITRHRTYSGTELYAVVELVVDGPDYSRTLDRPVKVLQLTRHRDQAQKIINTL